MCCLNCLSLEFVQNPKAQNSVNASSVNVVSECSSSESDFFPDVTRVYLVAISSKQRYSAFSRDHGSKERTRYKRDMSDYRR